MEIRIEEYNPEWPALFERIRHELEQILGEFKPRIEHVGSTAVPGLAAKPIIDILVGIESADCLDRTIGPMIRNHYIYYEIFNSSFPDRRLFVGLKDTKDCLRFQQTYTEKDEIPHEAINLLRLSHVHIWEYGTAQWIRHIAFRDYLKSHPEVTKEYAALKKRLSLISWKHGMAYNDAKDGFIKNIEGKAVLWYKYGR